MTTVCYKLHQQYIMYTMYTMQFSVHNAIQGMTCCLTLSELIMAELSLC